MKNNRIFKIIAMAVCSLTSYSVAAEPLDKQDYIADFSDPIATYSNANVGISDDGVDLSLGLGGYLAGSFKHKLQVNVKGDLEYTEVNYIAVDTSIDTGFILDSTWSKDLFWAKDTNDISAGIIKNLPFLDDRLNLYPKLKIGAILGDYVKSTTYIELDLATRFSVTSGFWVGVTPRYTYAMEGYELDEWNTSFDLGYMFKNGFGVSGQAVIDTHEADEYRANIAFAF